MSWISRSGAGSLPRDQLRRPIVGPGRQRRTYQWARGNNGLFAPPSLEMYGAKAREFVAHMEKGAL